MRTLCGTVLALAMAAGPVLAETDSFAGKEERCAAFSPCDLDFKCVWRGRSVFDAEMSFPDGVSFVPSAHYRAEVLQLPAEMRIVDAKGNVYASFVAPTNVAPPYTMHLSVDGARSAVVFASKGGDTRFVRYDKWPKGFDPRRKSFLRELSVRSDGGMSSVASSLSAGVGQADVRFVTRGREGALYREGGRLFFTFSARHGSACAVGSIDPAKPSDGWRLEGMILFDYGDGLLRNDIAPHIFLDDESGEWRGWACNFSTGSETGGRARGGVNAVWSKTIPLHGLSVMSAKSLGLGGMNEDPCGIYDKEAGKWRLLLSTFTPSGIRAQMFEADCWDGGFVPLSTKVKEDSTGTTIAVINGGCYCLSGSAEREYYVYSYPMLEKKGVIKMSPTPWGESKGWPHGRGWPALAEMPEGCPYRYLMLTMDRINYPGIPDPNWTYGAIFIYGANLQEKDKETK